MTCYDPCAHEQEILNRLATVEGDLLHYVQTINGVYGPFITINSLPISVSTEVTSYYGIESLGEVTFQLPYTNIKTIDLQINVNNGVDIYTDSFSIVNIRNGEVYSDLSLLTLNILETGCELIFNIPENFLMEIKFLRVTI